MSVLVKICGMTDQAAVDAAVASGADAIGFVFHQKSPRNVSPERAAALAATVPEDVLKVAVTLHPEPALWCEARDALNPDVLQTDLADFASLDITPDMTLWPVIREGSAPGDLPRCFVYEGPKSGHGETVDWQRAAEVARCGDMILAGGLDATNVAEAITRVRPWGVDVSSGVESAPGRKDPALINAFIAAAKAAVQQREVQK